MNKFDLLKHLIAVCDSILTYVDSQEDDSTGDEKLAELKDEFTTTYELSGELINESIFGKSDKDKKAVNNEAETESFKGDILFCDFYSKDEQNFLITYKSNAN